MALLEGPPVIAEDRLEGVLVDPLSVVCHGRWLYHTLPPGSTCLPSLPCAPPWSLQREQGQQKKGNSYTLKVPTGNWASGNAAFTTSCRSCGSAIVRPFFASRF